MSNLKRPPEIFNRGAHLKAKSPKKIIAEKARKKLRWQIMFIIDRRFAVLKARASVRSGGGHYHPDGRAVKFWPGVLLGVESRPRNGPPPNTQHLKPGT